MSVDQKLQTYSLSVDEPSQGWSRSAEVAGANEVHSIAQRIATFSSLDSYSSLGQNWGDEFLVGCIHFTASLLLNPLELRL